MNIESIRAGLQWFFGDWLLSFVKWTCVGFFLYTFLFGLFPNDVYAGMCAVLMLSVREERDDAEDEET